MISVLCLCVHNSARSQMAEAYFHSFGGDIIEVESAGLEPGKLNPFVVRALQEEGIEYRGRRPRTSLRSSRQAGPTATSSPCARGRPRNNVIFPGRSEKLHRPFPDLSTFTGSDEQVLAAVRAVRDQIREKVRDFVAELRKKGA